MCEMPMARASACVLWAEGEGQQSTKQQAHNILCTALHLRLGEKMRRIAAIVSTASIGSGNEMKRERGERAMRERKQAQNAPQSREARERQPPLLGEERELLKKRARISVRVRAAEHKGIGSSGWIDVSCDIFRGM